MAACNSSKNKNEVKMLYCGDCLDIMQTLPANSVDLILTDPPYGILYKSSQQNHQKTIINDSFDEWLELLPKMFVQFKRVLTETGCCCCCCGGGGKTPVTAIFTLEAIKHFHLIQTLIWEKTVGLGWRYRPMYENIVVLSKSKNDYNFYDTSKNCGNVIKGINKKIPQKGEHPTVKPVKLMEHLMKIHSLPGMVVLDPFMGSGTTGVAAKQLNRNFIGIELDKAYFDLATRRINTACQQYALSL